MKSFKKLQWSAKALHGGPPYSLPSGYTGRVSIAFSPDGSHLVTANDGSHDVTIVGISTTAGVLVFGATLLVGMYLFKKYHSEFSSLAILEGQTPQMTRAHARFAAALRGVKLPNYGTNNNL